jgi:hypothetical protein
VEPRKHSQPDEAVTLHAVMRLAIAEGLKEQCEVPRDIPHEMLVLLMQMNDDRRRKPNAPGAAAGARKRASG